MTKSDLQYFLEFDITQIIVLTFIVELSTNETTIYPFFTPLPC